MGNEFAPAKINLSLHITGRRCDGYHLLDSLVVFTDIGDHIWAEPSETYSLTLGGPHAAGLSVGEDNLVLRAAALLASQNIIRETPTPSVALHLEKILPISAGLGGGSADAAATLRLLTRMWGCSLPTYDETVKLGADVPVCINPKPQRMTGIGAQLNLLDHTLPSMGILLVNPNRALSTALVFHQLSARENSPMPAQLPRFASTQGLCQFLGQMRNDLEPVAVQILPEINQVIGALQKQKTCLLARMSGSGATCFGLFPDAEQAQAAQKTIAALAPEWWVRAGRVLG